MIAVVWWQAILNFLGSVLAALYKVIPNYGVAIILLTLLMRVVLLPLGIKQIRSMQAMQTIQPKVKALQQKYKGRPDAKQKITEETMALYKEHGVNPLGGCLPIVLQFPLLIALFAVLRVPGGIAHVPHDQAALRAPHSLYNDIRNNRTTFLGANLLCSAQQAGRTVPVKDKSGKVDTVIPQLKCGHGGAVRIPYYLFALAMIGTTYYQQRQMQRASPPGASQQQQTLTKIMPLLFGIWGFIFPAGLVVYWTTTNLVQIGQQHFMLPKAAPEPAPGAGASSPDGSRKAGPSKPSQGRGRRPGPSGRRPATGPRPAGGDQREPNSPETEGQQPPRAQRPGSAGGGGGRNAGNRKKRRKR
jgi:YidC/Oxa1 family membrane protein insertase